MRNSKIEKETGVNFDYILALKSTDAGLSVEKIDIPRNEDLIEELLEMYENTHYDASDMHRRAKRAISTTGYTYPFCLGNNYYDSYIDDIAFPDFDTYQYRVTLMDKMSHIDNSLKRGYIDFAKKLQGQLNAYIKKTKEEYLKQILPYTYSSDYNNALRANFVKEKYKIFSSEIHGRFTYETIINDDLKIITRTNFCYGSSTYFQIIVTYKGIELLPYGEWVKYYYAGYNSIMRFTRQYICVRASWAYAFDFIVAFVNKAIEDPDKFVREEVLSEVNTLMDGLEEIFQMSDEEFEKRLDVKHIDEDDTRYIGISSARHANERERQYYKIKKKECAMVYKMEKISGAIHFIKNLKNISELIPEVENSINRIIELNKIIYPEVIAAIPPVNEEIVNLTRELRKIEQKYKQKEKQFDYYKKRLDNFKKELIGDGRKLQEIEQEFKEKNPQYEILAYETNELWQEQNKYLTLINDREAVKKRLTSYKELIETINN